MTLISPEILVLWHEHMDGHASLDAFVDGFVAEHQAIFEELQDLELRLSTATGDDRVNYGKMVQIQEIYLDALLKLAILAAAQHRIIDGFISELIRKKLREATCLCFRIGRDRRIEVVFRAGANDWLMLDGHTVTPCSYHLLAGSKWSRALNELESLVNTAHTTEHDLQKFFEVYPELLAGNTYDTIIPQAVIVPDTGDHQWKADFVLSPFNQFDFATVLELKLPFAQTTVQKRPAHHSFSAHVWHSIQQVKDYADQFDSPTVRRRFREAYHVDIFKPDIHLIVGQRWNVAQSEAIKRMKRDSNVRVETWSEVIERLKREFASA
jgi:hypothetical protein